MTSRIFTDQASEDVFLAFRSELERAERSDVEIYLDVRKSCLARGLALARWLGEFGMTWPRFVQRLEAGLEGVPEDMVATPYELLLLPGGRGRLLILNRPLLLQSSEFAGSQLADRLSEEVTNGAQVAWIGGDESPVRINCPVVTLAPVAVS